VPSFVFVDEIDAIAGRHTRKILREGQLLRLLFHSSMGE